MNTIPQRHFASARRIADLTVILDTLLASSPELLRDFILHGTTEHGIYAISDPEDAEIVYVGRTVTHKEGLRGRMWDHVNNNQPSDLNQKLGGDRAFTGLHQVRVLPTPDNTTRRLTELFGITVLNPKYNK